MSVAQAVWASLQKNKGTDTEQWTGKEGECFLHILGINTGTTAYGNLQGQFMSELHQFCLTNVQVLQKQPFYKEWHDS